jgi:hypothetical protein
MAADRRMAQAALLLATGVALSVVAGPPSALAASITFIGTDVENRNWDDPGHWSPAAVPGSADDVLVPEGVGVEILEGGSETVQSLHLDAGLNVNEGGSLHVTGDVTNNGVDRAYFVSAGTIHVDGTIFNTCTNCGDDDPGNDYWGYIANAHEITATNLDNAGAVINGDGASGLTGVSWTGSVVNRATGYVSNTGATWNGAVTSNDGGIYNDYGGTWNGAVASNSATIQNDGGSFWNGDVASNHGVIFNIEGATWTGDVQSNDDSIDNDGGTWNGDVLSNSGAIFNTSVSTWNGNLTSSGSLWLSGTVRGFVDNQSGGTLYVFDPLSGVTSLTNNGAFTMQDGRADDSLSAESWSGTGTATFDFAPGLGRSDHVVLSGDYTADTTLGLSLVGPSGRALVDVPLILVGGADTGSLDVTGLPEDGVISYRLVRNDEGWIVTTALNDAPAHAASAVALLARGAADATAVPMDRTGGCDDGRWVRGLGRTQSGTLSGTRSGLSLVGLQIGDDMACYGLGKGAKLGIGMTAGGLGGSLDEDFGSNDRLNGSFAEGFAGVYGDLTAGQLHAMLQGQLGVSSLTVSDPRSAVERAALTNIRYDLRGDASYAFEFGAVTLAPETGFSVSNVDSNSSNFADVGAMDLSTGMTLDAFAGASLKAHWTSPNGTAMVAPYVSLLFHGVPVSPDSAEFSDHAGGSATVPLDRLGNYGAVKVGADLFDIARPTGQAWHAGVTADFKFGCDFSEDSYAAYAQMKF